VLSPEAENAVLPYTRWLPRPAQAVARDLESFCEMLTKWNRAQNLVSRETLEDVWQRHIADSLQLLPLLTSARTIVDIGSGGGFPALPLAIAAQTSGQRFVLIEPNTRKAAFLRAVIRRFGLDAAVEGTRVESADIVADVVTARAVAALPLLLDLAQALFGPATRALFHKGREYEDEVAQAAAQWVFDVIIHPSRTAGGGVILEISKLERRQSFT
jgi:16S rRNA (guanine527-N7)-methyltransferase